LSSISRVPLAIIIGSFTVPRQELTLVRWVFLAATFGREWYVIQSHRTVRLPVWAGNRVVLAGKAGKTARFSAFAEPVLW
jgi:hypothetical protein